MPEPSPAIFSNLIQWCSKPSGAACCDYRGILKHHQKSARPFARQLAGANTPMPPSGTLKRPRNLDTRYPLRDDGRDTRAFGRFNMAWA